MPKPLRRRPRPKASVLRRRHRARILVSLLDVCRELERLKLAPEARLACRDVAGWLRTALARETKRLAASLKVDT